MLSVDIQKRFTGFTLNVQFEAERGVTALLGASGSGKSVTLQCIAGVMKPDAGRIVRDGKVLFDKKKGIDLPPQQRHVGLLFQHYALFPNMTLQQNVEAGIRNQRGSARRARAMALLASYHIEGLGGLYPHQLSGGQQQRAALCRILASEPEALLLDEPFAALDSHLKWQLEREMMATLNSFGGEALLVTHDRGEAYRLSDHACVMDRGRNEAPVPTEQLFTAPRTRTAARLSGCKNIVAIERLGAHTLRVPAWGGQTLRTVAEIPQAARYLGIRAHLLRFGGPDEENALPVRVAQITPDLFSLAYTLRAGSALIYLEGDKAMPCAPQPGNKACVIVPPDAMMLLESE